MYMIDLTASGVSIVDGGKYDKVCLSGSSDVEGNLECKSFHSSGAHRTKGDLTCSGDVSVSGSYENKGSVSCDDTFKASGSTKIGGNLKSAYISASGRLSVGGEVEGEDVIFSGSVEIGGLLNAEKIDINVTDGKISIGSIGGGEITVRPRREEQQKSRIFGIVASKPRQAVIEDSIEGDVITLEYVKARSVVGRIVKIGANCDIESVQYTESADISVDARVNSSEKV
ncbi:MAG: hypothetical protein LUH54_04515 [Firmicutes bacterium]|nr:hypothetical protein [Bacillota bacterium]